MTMETVRPCHQMKIKREMCGNLKAKGFVEEDGREREKNED